MPVDGSTPVSFFKRSFDLYEQLSETMQGWDLDCRQLGRNKAPFELEQFVTRRLLYSRVYSDCPFYQLGGPTPEFRTFALQTNISTPFHWCGQSITRQSLIIFPVGGDFESNSHAGFDTYALSISEELLEHTAQLQYQRPLSDFLGAERGVCNSSPEAVARLRSMLRVLSVGVARWTITNSGPGVGSQIVDLEEKIAEAVLWCLQQGRVNITSGKLSRRMVALGKALDIIESTPLELLHLPTVLGQVDVSRRTLEHAFQDRFDVSPAAYIKALRLKALSKALMHGDSKQLMVRDVCKDHGFHHLGQLANDYSKLYGELPSFTLRRTAV